MGGFSYNSGALSDIATKLRAGSKGLTDTASAMPPSPDAGSSSALVGQVISDLLTAGATSATMLDQAASNIHANQGSYDTTENNNAGTMHRQQQTGLGGIDTQSPAAIYPG